MAFIFATLIQTIIINKIDGNLSDINGKILHHNNATLRVMQIVVDTKVNFLVRAIDVFELNNRKINYFNSPVISELDSSVLEEKIFNTTRMIIKAWNRNFKDSPEREVNRGILEKNLNRIIKNQDVSFDDRLKELENIRKVEFQAFEGRFKKYLDKLEVYRSDDRKCKGEKIFWSRWFICLQVLGLLLLGISQILIAPGKNKSITTQSSGR